MAAGRGGAVGERGGVKNMGRAEFISQSTCEGQNSPFDQKVGTRIGIGERCMMREKAPLHMREGVLMEDED